MPNFLSPDIKAKAAGEGAATATTPAGGGSSDTEGVEDSTESEDEATTTAALGSLNKKKNDRDSLGGIRGDDDIKRDSRLLSKEVESVVTGPGDVIEKSDASSQLGTPRTVDVVTPVDTPVKGGRGIGDGVEDGMLIIGGSDGGDDGGYDEKDNETGDSSSLGSAYKQHNSEAGAIISSVSINEGSTNQDSGSSSSGGGDVVNEDNVDKALELALPVSLNPAPSQSTHLVSPGMASTNDTPITTGNEKMSGAGGGQGGAVGGSNKDATVTLLSDDESKQLEELAIEGTGKEEEEEEEEEMSSSRLEDAGAVAEERMADASSTTQRGSGWTKGAEAALSLSSKLTSLSPRDSKAGGWNINQRAEVNDDDDDDDDDDYDPRQEGGSHRSEQQQQDRRRVMLCLGAVEALAMPETESGAGWGYKQDPYFKVIINEQEAYRSATIKSGGREVTWEPERGASMSGLTFNENNDSGDGVAVAAAVDKMTASTLLPSVQIYLDGSPVDVSSSVVSVAELRNALHEPLSANQLRVRIEVR